MPRPLRSRRLTFDSLVVTLVLAGIIGCAVGAFLSGCARPVAAQQLASGPHTPLVAWASARMLHRTEWRNGCVPSTDRQSVVRSEWNPDGQTFESRYGMTAEQRACYFGYTGDTAGAHGLAVAQAYEAMDRLGIPRSGPSAWNAAATWDSYDMSMVTGLTAALKGASPDPGEQPPPPATAPTPRPPSGECLSGQCSSRCLQNCGPAPTPTPAATPAPAATPCPPAPPCPSCPPPPAPLVTLSDACRRAVEQLADGKPQGPNRTAGIRECRTALERAGWKVSGQ